MMQTVQQQYILNWHDSFVSYIRQYEMLIVPYAPAERNHPDSLMGRGYLNERATGGAVASSPYRGRPWRGWMFLCFFLCAKESKRNGVWGYPPARGNTSLHVHPDSLRVHLEIIYK